MKIVDKTFSKNIPYGRAAFLFVVAFTIIRGCVAFTMELGGDEAYYWLYSQHLKSNYFDHPPMIAVFVRFFTANLLLQDYEGFIRLGSLVACGFSSWFIYNTCKLLHSSRAGFYSVCLYNVSFYAGVTAGLLTMPDSPQMLFYTFSLWMIARLCTNERNWYTWILFGLATGLCIMSKVHGVFIWIGMGLFILFCKRSWLTLPQLYLALLISILLTSPIIVWNLQNDFATYRFNSERVTITDETINLKSFASELVSQVFFNNPFNFFLVALGLGAYVKGTIHRLEALTIFQFIALPLAVLLLILSLFRSTILPHWSGPAYVALIPVAAVFLAERGSQSRLPGLLVAGITGFVSFIVGWQLVNNFYPGTYGSKSAAILGMGDVTLDKVGRRSAGQSFEVFFQDQIKRGVATRRTPVVYYKWWAADIEYYFCRPYGTQMIGLGNLYNLHEYMWMNEERKDKVDMRTAYCITPSEDRDDMHLHYSPYYSSIEQVTVIQTIRGGEPARNFYIYRMDGWKNNWPAIQTAASLTGKKQQNRPED